MIVQPFSIKTCYMKFLLLFYFSLVFCCTACAQNDNKAFGDSIFVSDGLMGRIYLLPPNTLQLPDFDTMRPVNTIYTQSINIPPRSWSEGFPGLRDQFE